MQPVAPTQPASPSTLDSTKAIHLQDITDQNQMYQSKMTMKLANDQLLNSMAISATKIVLNGE